MTDIEKRNGMFFTLMFFAMLSYGGSWPSAKAVAGYTAQEVLVFWRFLLTFISFLPVIAYLKIPVRLEKKALTPVLIGSVLLVLYNKLLFLGLKTGLAGAGGVLVTTSIPICTFLISALYLKRKLNTREITGLVLGFVGGLIVMEIWKLDAGQFYQSGSLWLLMAAIFWALLTITSQKSQEHLSPLLFSFYTAGFSALLDLLFALPYDVLGVLGFDYVFWLNMIYLSAVVTTFGTTAYFLASVKVGASKASAFIFLVPASALIISWLVLGEQPKAATIIGGIMAMSAVYLITIKTDRRETAST